MLAEAVSMFEAIGASHFVLETKVFQLECEVLAGNAAEAVAAAAPLFRLAEEAGDQLLEILLWRSKAWAHFAADEYAEANALADRCIVTGETIGATYEVALALILRGFVSAATGGDRKPDHARARALLGHLGVVSLPRLSRDQTPQG
jgi:hypothetical protein